MYPDWLHVGYAIARFGSFWNAPDVAAKNDVVAPIMAINIKVSGAYSEGGEHRTTKNTPAVHVCLEGSCATFQAPYISIGFGLYL